MQGAYLNDRSYAFVLMTLLLAPKEGHELAGMIGESEKISVQAALQAALERTQGDQKALLSELRHLSTESRRSALGEIHPDWILEALIPESPRVIAAILRYLPEQHTRYVLDHLPPELLAEMPPLSQTFSLDPELVLMLKKNFEKNFFVPNCQPLKRELDFSLIPFLSGKKLVTLFRELGFKEMAMAFATLNEKTVNLILRRLPPRDAASLKKYLGVKKQVEAERLRQAQSHLLSLNLQKGAAETLIIEIGFYVYSKALLPEGEFLFRLMEQKLPLSLGRLLRLYIEKNRALNMPDLALNYQREVVEIAQRLLKG